MAECGQLSLCRTLPFLVGPCDVCLSTFAERPGSNLHLICWVRPSAGWPVPWGRWCSVVWAWAAGRRIQSNNDSSSPRLVVILCNAPGALAGMAAPGPEGPVCVERTVRVLQVHIIAGGVGLSVSALQIQNFLRDASFASRMCLVSKKKRPWPVPKVRDRRVACR